MQMAGNRRAARVSRGSGLTLDQLSDVDFIGLFAGWQPHPLSRWTTLDELLADYGLVRAEVLDAAAHWFGHNRPGPEPWAEREYRA